MKRNILKCFALIVTMVAVLVNVSAQLVWDGTSSPWTHGTGTESDPYLIETPQNLAWLSDMVNNGVSTYSGVYFKQTEDFNMNTLQFNAIGAHYYFSGHYDGNFKCISNLVISDLSIDVGLFGNTRNATLKRICVKGIRGSGSSSNKLYVGAINGYAYNDTIIQCCCIGDVVLRETSPNTGTLFIGGLVGYAYESVIKQCFMKGNVTSARYYSNCAIGGLIGYARGQKQEVSTSYTTTTSGSILKVISSYFNGNIIVTGNTNSGESAIMGLLIGDYLIGQANKNSYLVVISNTYYAYSVCNSYAVGGFTRPSSYITNDVIMGGQTNSFARITSNINSYSGTNLPTTTLYATNRTDVYMKSAAMPTLLNSGLDSTVFFYDSLNVNDGYPIFSYQKPIRYWVNVSFDASKGSVTGMGSYASGSTATLQAEAAEGYIFSGWSDGNIENPRTVTVSSDSTYNAIFTKNAYTIHVKQNCSVDVE